MRRLTIGMGLRGRFIAVFVAFSVGLTAVLGLLAWQAASIALERELDRTARWVPAAAVATGLQSSNVVGLRPGFENESAWRSMQARLIALQFVVGAAYILREDNTTIVTTFSADSIPIGSSLPEFDVYTAELAEARDAGYAASPRFRGTDGRFYAWGFAELDQSDIILAVRLPADYEEGLDALRRNLLAGSVVAALVAALLAAALSAGVVRPVERLSRVAIRIQRGQMDEPVAEERGDELGRLSRAMERMRQGIQERDDQLRLMLAQVAHEIRNPLGGVELFASAAADTEDPVERRRLIARVRSEVAALNDIINDFLMFARPVEPTRQPMDIRQALREAAELIGAEMEGAGGSLEISLGDEPLVSRVAAEHVKRIALNLLRNAAQAADAVRITATVRDGEIVVTVSDDGPGIDQDMRERVFEPFVTDKEQGAGLGLAIVKKIVTANGGRVVLARPEETDGGRGAEFRVYFDNLEDPPRPEIA